jgi:hypothetical protein
MAAEPAIRVFYFSPNLYDVLAGRISVCVAKTRADKLCRNNGVRMNVANDLAVVEA